MPRYFFNLNDGQKIIPDLEGTELPDDDSARAHAVQVARELARNRERETRSWRLAVCDAEGTLRFELLFGSMDEVISRLPPVIRFMFEDADDSTASLKAMEQVRMTLLSYEGREGGALAQPHCARNAAVFLSADPIICAVLVPRHIGTFLCGTKSKMASYARGATPATGIVP